MRSLSLCAAPRAHLFAPQRPSSSACSCWRLSRAHNIRQLSSRSARLRRNEDGMTGAAATSSSQFSFRGMPAPPRLPREEQEIFEALQRQSTGAFSTPRVNQSPDSSFSKTEGVHVAIDERVDSISRSSSAPGLTDGAAGGGSQQLAGSQDCYDHVVIEASGEGEELHPNLVRGAQPEFEGERNPKTGEIGGPKNEPLRWGPSGEWTYNGRTTDF
ncbi:uncharacterized protein Z519_10681 [Cladophialophora bantiana CBS 173.52]|uniref:Succinate dehydrogenase assembly factor 4, mitochondrial n=1 Tax=Cladophialophora bantiana (strain ATCC 10958 / CBS 173.52 / CDC B-1940 / NIH 8579) TaxID=1442370 RepID=A0A0D2HCK1_CLAB1|nr:uncharacterized protein Z519_10681 [Cladophialophora bantiana CBS 173.52]KIW88635.1 hypothetical protein Z519_10681 [Cladophialophora bantiana CBS 173.52]